MHKLGTHSHEKLKAVEHNFWHDAKKQAQGESLALKTSIKLIFDIKIVDSSKLCICFYEFMLTLRKKAVDRNLVNRFVLDVDSHTFLKISSDFFHYFTLNDAESSLYLCQKFNDFETFFRPRTDQG